MASPRLSRRVAKVVRYPPLSEMSEDQRREFQDALLEADALEDLPGKLAGGHSSRPSRTGRSWGSVGPPSPSSAPGQRLTDCPTTRPRPTLSRSRHAAGVPGHRSSCAREGTKVEVLASNIGAPSAASTLWRQLTRKGYLVGLRAEVVADAVAAVLTKAPIGMNPD
jgi:hypothetical protein